MQCGAPTTQQPPLTHHLPTHTAHCAALCSPAHRSGDLDPPFRGPLPLGTALAYFADVLSSPHRDALLALASCATDSKEAARLTHLASAAGKAEYTEYIGRAQRSLMEVRRDVSVFLGGCGGVTPTQGGNWAGSVSYEEGSSKGKRGAVRSSVAGWYGAACSTEVQCGGVVWGGLLYRGPVWRGGMAPPALPMCVVMSRMWLHLNGV